MTQKLKIHDAAALLASQFGTGETAWYVRLCRAAVQGRLTLRHADGFPVEPRTISAEPAIASHVLLGDVSMWLESQGLAALQPTLVDPEPAPSFDNRRGITTDDLCAAFADLHWSSLQWRQTVATRVPNWLAGARIAKGRGGADRQQALWCPVEVAHSLLRGRYRGARVHVDDLERAFKVRAELKLWRDEWRQFREDHPEIG
jgi:hypothetical protein